MLLPVYLGLLDGAERALAESFRQVAGGHAAKADVFHTCHTLAQQCDQHLAALAAAVARYGEADADEPERLHAEALPTSRSGPLGLLRDLQDLLVLGTLVEVTWTMVRQAGLALRDEELLATVSSSLKQTGVQLAWLRTRMKEAAPQALLAAS
jgi:hypothetical protein